VARAKQTTRAEARRRYRQTATTAELEGGDLSSEASATPAAHRTTGTASPQRTGFLGSFQKAYHRPNYREDLRLLPTLLRGPWFLVGAGLVVVGFLAEVLFPNYTGSNLLFSLVTVPPAMVPIFLIGFTAPRASYLLGLIVGILDLILYVIFIAVFLPRPPDESLPIGEVFLNGVVTGLPAAALFAAAAAFYRRFLALTSPRTRAGASSSRGKSANRGKSAGRRF
jgi:hypothetical protein